MKKFKRPSWDEIFMFQAISAATRHSCLKRAVGAVFVKNKRVIASGYNGAACGIKSCLELGYCYYDDLAWYESKTNGKNFEDVREFFKIYCQVVHAEVNAAAQCSLEKLTDSVLYVTNYPCPQCTQDVIITRKISRVYVWKEYLRNEILTIDERRASDKKLNEAGISIKLFPMTKERICEIANYMANHVGERTPYKFVLIE